MTQEKDVQEEMLRQALTPKFDAAWEELARAQVLQGWYRKIINKCTTKVVGTAQACWLFKLMSRDLDWLPSKEWLEKLDSRFLDVTVPAQSLHANIQDEAEVGSPISPSSFCSSTCTGSF